MEHTVSLTRRRFVASMAVGTGVGFAGCGSERSPSEPSERLSYGDTVEGTLDSEASTEPKYGDRAVGYTFEADAEDICRVSMSSEAFDTYLLLEDADGSIIAENDDSNGTNSELIRGLPQGGAHSIWASSLSGSGTGQFTLALDRGEQRELRPPSASPLAVGDTVTGQLRRESPPDPYFRDPSVPYLVQGTRDQSLRVTMESSVFDTFLLLTDEYGGRIAVDDDGASGMDSQIESQLPRDGTYVVWAGSFSGNGRGEFTLSLHEEPP